MPHTPATAPFILPLAPHTDTPAVAAFAALTPPTTHEQHAPSDPAVIGSQVIYHGSLSDHHGQAFLLLPDSFAVSGAGSRSRAEDPVPLYTLDSPETGLTLSHARRGSFTVITGLWWPEDAIDFLIAETLYKASHTTPGGSPQSRTVHFHTATGRLYTTWCFFDEVTPQIQALDQRSYRRI